MARLLYAASPADYFINPDGTPNPTATATAWTARTGGAQLTDLLDASGSATNVVSADNLGGFRFSGPDAYTGSVWVQGSGGTRYEVKPTGMAERIAILEAALTQEIADRIAGDASALVTAQGYTDDVVDAHEAAANPHPQYAIVVDASGTVIGSYKLKVIGAGGAFPSTVDLKTLLFFGG